MLRMHVQASAALLLLKTLSPWMLTLLPASL
jgi:hypothetical protein